MGRSHILDDGAERTKAEATIPLVPGRNEDFVHWDYFDFGICKVRVYFGIKYFSVTFVMTAFLHMSLNW